MAEALGDLDPRIDYREIDAKAEGLDWTGFHRIEKDLWEPAKGALNSDGETDAWQDWEPSTPAQRAESRPAGWWPTSPSCTTSSTPTTSRPISNDQGVDWLSNGAMALLDEVASRQDHRRGGLVVGHRPVGLRGQCRRLEAGVHAGPRLRRGKSADGAALVERIDGGYTALETALAKYGNLEQGFVTYGELTDEHKRNLTNLINALAEPLSQLTSTILS